MAVARRETPLKVTSLGYFNHRNFGDDLLQATIAGLFMHHAVNFHAWTPSCRALNESDLIVVGGGSIWPDASFFSREPTLFQQVRAPFAVIGISARRSDSLIAARTRQLVEESVFFHVRDDDTAQELGRPSNVRCGADLFWWSADFRAPPAPEEARRTVALNLRSWKKMTWAPDAMMSVLAQSGYKVLPMPLYFGSTVHDAAGDMDDAALMRELGLSVPVDLWDEAPLAQSSIVVSMRFHGLLLGIRAGRPVIGFDYHPKIRSLFRDLGIPELLVPLDDPIALQAALAYVDENYDELLLQIGSYRDRCIMQGGNDRRAFVQCIDDYFDRIRGLKQ